MTQPDAEVIPLRPSEADQPGVNAQARAPARPREDGEDRPQRVMSLTMPAISGLLAGGSVVHSRPLSIMGLWAQHCAAAGYYRRWWARWPRYAYGAWHSFVEAPLAYLWIWSGDSLAKRLGFVTVIAAVVLIVKFGR